MPRKKKSKNPTFEFDDLMAQAADLPPGPLQIAVFEEAIRLADSLNEDELGFDARTQLMGAALQVGRGDILSVAFTWCLAKYDADPERYFEFDVYWAFRWTISELVPHPQFGRAQIEEMVADMRRRYEAIGVSMRSVEYLRMNIADDLGDRELARESMTAARRLPRDWLADDPDSERAFEVRILAFFGREGDAIRKAEPYLSLKEADDYNTPKAIANLLVPLLRRKRTEQAAALCKWAIRVCKSNPRHVDWYAMFIRFLALTGNLNQGLRLFRKHLSDAFEWVHPAARFDFCAMTPMLLDRLAEKGRKTVNLRLPAALSGGDSAESVKVETLASRLRAEAKKLASLFDARNGNSWYSDLLAEQAELVKLTTDWPLDPA